MSQSLKAAILRNPQYVSGDDCLSTENDIIATATLVLDRIADEREAIADAQRAVAARAEAVSQKYCKRLNDAHEAFENHDFFPRRVIDSDGWQIDISGGIPAYMTKVVYLEAVEGASDRVRFIVEWSEDQMRTNVYT